jgi:hypothetical protein
MSTDRTRVYFTVDVEGAEERVVRGRPVPPQGYDLRVWCKFRNRRDELGLGLITRELDAFGFKGTFFTEVFGSYFFGEGGLRAICSRLRDGGHDVQLHTHPIQRNAGFRSKGDPPAADNLAAYDEDEQTALIREGIELLARAGVPKDDVVALRAGNFGASNETWTAMKRAGLALSSNYNPCYFAKGCVMRSDDARAGLFAATDGVWELPITNFVERSGAPRHLQITAVSSDEIYAAMRDARARGVREICIVTHSFEFCHIDSVEERRGRPNTLNVHRLKSLCRFLAASSADFEVDTCGALGKRLARGEERADPAAPRDLPRGRTSLRARRLVEQAFKRIEARVPFALP